MPIIANLAKLGNLTFIGKKTSFMGQCYVWSELPKMFVQNVDVVSKFEDNSLRNNNNKLKSILKFSDRNGNGDCSHTCIFKLIDNRIKLR